MIGNGLHKLAGFSYIWGHRLYFFIQLILVLLDRILSSISVVSCLSGICRFGQNFYHKKVSKKCVPAGFIILFFKFSCSRIHVVKEHLMNLIGNHPISGPGKKISGEFLKAKTATTGR